MDAVSKGGDWDVCLSQDGGGKLKGVLVYYYRRSKGFKVITMPPMTAYNGIHIIYPEDYKQHKRVSHEVAVTKELLGQLPKCSLYYQQFPPYFKNWLPFHWDGYRQTTRYTYLMDKSIGEEALRKKLKGNLRRSFNQLELITELRDHDFDSLWPEMVQISKKKNQTLHYDKAALKNLFDNLDSGALLAKGCHHKESGELMAGVVVAKDKTRNYGIVNFNNPDSEPNGALGYLIWKTMFELDTKVTDFEGSMLEEVEFFLRAFGGVLTPHHKIYKIHNPLLKILIPLLKPQFFE